MPEIAWIIDDDVNLQRLVARTLRDLGMVALPFFDGETALAHTHDATPTCAIVDVSLPTIDGFEVVRRLRKHPQLASLPVLVLTTRDAPEQEKRARDLGAMALPKPFRLPFLQSALRALRVEAERVRAKSAAKRSARVLIVDDDPDLRAALSMLVDDEGHEAIVAADAFEALRFLGEDAARPDVALIDIMLPGLDGSALAARVKSATAHAATPIVMMSAFDSLPAEAARVGAVAALKKPFERQALVDVLARTLSPAA